MKLSPLAEIKRDELAEQRAKNYTDNLQALVHGTFNYGFSAGYAFANQESYLKTKALARAVDYYKEDPGFTLDDFLNAINKYFEEIEAEYRQGSKE